MGEELTAVLDEKKYLSEDSTARLIERVKELIASTRDEIREELKPDVSATIKDNVLTVENMINVSAVIENNVLKVDTT